MFFIFLLLFLFHSFRVEIWDNVNNGPLDKKKLIELIQGKYAVYASAFDIYDEDVIKAACKSFYQNFVSKSTAMHSLAIITSIMDHPLLFKG